MAKAKKKFEEMTPARKTAKLMFDIATATREQYIEMFAKHPKFRNTDDSVFVNEDDLKEYFVNVAHPNGIFQNAKSPDQDERLRYNRFYVCALNRTKNYVRRLGRKWDNNPQKFLEHQRGSKLKKSGTALSLPTTPPVEETPIRSKGPHPGPADPSQQTIPMPPQPMPRAFVEWKKKFKEKMAVK